MINITKGWPYYYIVRTDEGQPRSKYIFNKCGPNIYFFYSTEVGSITITKFQKVGHIQLHFFQIYLKKLCCIVADFQINYCC